ncbi:MAG: hypothetical protein ACF8PN_02055 [Phycisphaerales bacterium]
MGRDLWVIATYGLLLVLCVLLIIGGLVGFEQAESPEWLVVGVLGLIIVTALAPLAMQPLLRRGDPTAAKNAEIMNQQIELLTQIHEHTLLSDAAKRIAYRRNEREMLRRAIEEDIAHEDWEAASVLVRDMAEQYGYREQAEEFRRRIEEARSEVVQRRLEEEFERINQLIDHHEWAVAYAEAARIKRLFPDERRVQGIDVQIRHAWEDHKHALEREFLDAADRGEVDHAMELLKELDQYLTEREAEPYREVARGVISKARENLGLQFKLAVQDRDWRTASRVGEMIITEFPNTLMAREVREKIDVIRAKATGGFETAEAAGSDGRTN